MLSRLRAHYFGTHLTRRQHSSYTGRVGQSSGLDGEHPCLQFGFEPMRPLQLAVTWYKIRHAGEQAVHWDILNKATS